jgi:hypothetical protein
MYGPEFGDWARMDWAGLDHIRTRFLDAPHDQGPVSDYWSSESLLASYDATFGRRILWKWRGALSQLKTLGWTLPSGARVIDWGCGSGVASEALSEFGWDAPDRGFADRSALARGYCVSKFPGARDLGANPSLEGATVLLSHVLDELGGAGERALIESLLKADRVLWVEAGTQLVSRRLSALRDTLIAGGFRAVAPCTHSGACGALAPGNERHWCHFFADPPNEVHHDPGWTEFSKRLGVDLRALPYAFLCLERKPALTPPSDFHRLVGRPRLYKAFAKVQSCHGQHGVAEFILPKRQNPEIFKALKKTQEPWLARWVLDGETIQSGEMKHDGQEVP